MDTAASFAGSPELTAILGILTVLGFVATIYFGVKSTRLDRARKKLDYADLQTCANDLGAKLKKTFVPDVCFTPGLNGATFANLLVREFGHNIPVYVGQTFSLEDTKHLKDRGSRYLDTSKWRVFIPDVLFKYVGCKVLIIDDFAMSGDFLRAAKEIFVDAGFSDSQVKTVTIAATKVAVKTNKGPDLVWMTSESDEFYFPWGRAD